MATKTQPETKRTGKAALMGRTAAHCVREMATHNRANVRDAHDIQIAHAKGDSARVYELASDIAKRATGMAFVDTYLSSSNYADAERELSELTLAEREREKRKKAGL